MKCFSIKDNWMKCDDISINYIEYGYDEAVHTHDAIEISYTVSGSGEHIVNDSIIRAQRGTLIIMDYNCVHSIKHFESMKSYNIMFKEPFLTGGDAAERIGLGKLLKEYYDTDYSNGFISVRFQDERDADRIEKLLFDTLEEGLGKNTRYREIIRCNLDAIMNLAIRKMGKDCAISVDFFLEEVIKYIDNHSGEPLMLDETAKRFNYKPRYLSNKLKEYCGLNFKQLLINKRLNNVMYGLIKTDDSIEDIIRKCGFTNKTYFYDIFEKAYGIKPKFVREYKNNFIKYLSIKSRYKNLLSQADKTDSGKETELGND